MKCMRIASLSILVAILIAGASAQTAPSLYGAPQKVYDILNGTPTFTLNLPNSGQGVPSPTIYIIETAIRGSNTQFGTPAGFSDFCTLQVDKYDREQIFYKVYSTGQQPQASVSLPTNGYTWAGAIAVAYQGIDASIPFDGMDCKTAGKIGPAQGNVPNSNPTSLTSPSFSHQVSTDKIVWAFFATNNVGTDEVSATLGEERAEILRTDTEARGYMNWTDLTGTCDGSACENKFYWTPNGWGVLSTGVIAMALAPDGSSPAQPPQIVTSSVAPNVGNTTAPVPAAPGHAQIKGLDEVVSPENGSVSFSFPLPLPPGRQLTPQFSINYDSAGAHFLTSTADNEFYDQTEDGMFAKDGWSYAVPMLTYSTHRSSPDGVITCTTSSGYVYQGPSGNRIPFNLSLTGWIYGSGGGSDSCDSQYQETSEAQVGAWNAQATPILSHWWEMNSVTVTDPDGNQITFPGSSDANAAVIASSITDRNGNFVDYSVDPNNHDALTITDTLDRQIKVSSFAQPTDTITIPGMSSQYTVAWADQTPTGQVSITGVGSSPCTSQYVNVEGGTAVTSITTPQGTYTFSYDSTYGLLSKITYPNGGYVRYVWGTSADPSDEGVFSQVSGGTVTSCTAQIDSPVLTDRYVSPDGNTETEHQQFTYTTTWDTPLQWSSKTTTVTTYDLLAGTSYTTTYSNTSGSLQAPPNAATYVGAQLPLAETVTTTDTHGTVIRTVTQNWQTSYPFQLADTTTSLNGLNVSKTSFAYDPTYARLTQKDDYGFPGGTEMLLREMDIAYASFSGANIFDRPSSVIIKNGSGAWVAETDFDYDESPVTATSGVIQHDSVSGARANLTSIRRRLASGGSALITTFTYDDTGQRLSVTDPAGNTSTSAIRTISPPALRPGPQTPTSPRPPTLWAIPANGPGITTGAPWPQLRAPTATRPATRLTPGTGSTRSTTPMAAT